MKFEGVEREGRRDREGREGEREGETGGGERDRDREREIERGSVCLFIYL